MILNPLLWVTTVLFALILGGNLYEQMVIVGRWADDPPASLVFWREIMEAGHFHFYALTPIALAASVLSLPFGWRQHLVRRDLIVASLSIMVVLLITFLWAFPVLGGLFPEQVLGRAAAAKLPSKTPAELAQLISKFKMLSSVRWFVLLVGFLAMIYAVRASQHRNGKKA
jgi:hypothetical protein